MAEKEKDKDLLEGQDQDQQQPEAEAAAADGPDAYLAELQAKGLGAAEILTLMNAKFGGQDSAVAQVPELRGEVGLDPQMLAQTRRRIAEFKGNPKTSYKLAALDKEDPELRALIKQGLKQGQSNMAPERLESFADKILALLDDYGGVELHQDFYQWVQQWRFWQSALRRMEDSMAEAAIIELIVREHWQLHSSERAMLQGLRTGGRPGTGPAGMYNPVSGMWEERRF